MFLTTLQLFRYICTDTMLPHLVRFNSCLLSASEIIPLCLRTVKRVFANFTKLQKITFVNPFIVLLIPGTVSLSFVNQVSFIQKTQGGRFLVGKRPPL